MESKLELKTKCDQLNVGEFGEFLKFLFHTARLGKPTLVNSEVFLTLFNRPLTPPPRFEHVCCKSFERILEMCGNACHNKTRQNNA